MLGGGLLSVGLEPVRDTMGKVWYAKDNPWVVYTGMGVPLPAFLVLGCALFWGGSVYVGFEVRPEPVRWHATRASLYTDVLSVN